MLFFSKILRKIFLFMKFVNVLLFCDRIPFSRLSHIFVDTTFFPYIATSIRATHKKVNFYIRISMNVTITTEVAILSASTLKVLLNVVVKTDFFSTQTAPPAEISMSAPQVATVAKIVKIRSDLMNAPVPMATNYRISLKLKN